MAQGIKAPLSAHGPHLQTCHSFYYYLNIEKDCLIPLEKQIVKCETDILELEQHVEGATRLTARVANLRGRYDMLRQNTKALMAKGTESITAGQRAQITLNGVEETLDRVNNLISEIKETKIGNVSSV